MDQIKTGQFLKTLRKEKGLTQQQLADRFNVSNRSVSRWETGSNLPDISLLVEIADFYGVDVRDIIDGKRASSMMDNETKEVADKMASYATNEKSNLLKVLQAVSIAGVAVSLVAIILQGITYEPDIKRAGAILATFAAFIALCITTLYVTGLLGRIASNKKAVTAIKITVLCLMALISFYVVIGVLIFSLLFTDFLSSKIKVTNDIADYNTYIHNPKGQDCEYGLGAISIFDVMPDQIDVPAEEFQIMYYNPWDAQYVVYMTLDLGDRYDEELARLNSIGIDSYEGIYSVTGEPQGFDLIAMDSDEYHGFCYAMVPEDRDNNTSITYCAIVFCNYFLDIDVHDYMPDSYLLPGFDASADNPYRAEMMGE